MMKSDTVYRTAASGSREQLLQRHYKRRRQRVLRRALCIAAVLLAAAAVTFLSFRVAPMAPADEPEASALPAGGLPGAAAGEGAIVVAIDPGHGGYNPNIGTVDVGCAGFGYTEPDLTYPTAQALAELLTADGRFAPVLTTDGSAYMLGSERAEAANEAGAQLVLAIHMNADGSESTRGFECYPSTPALAYNADALRFAGLITAGFAENGALLRGENGIRYLYFHGDNDERLVFESSDTEVHTDPTFGVVQYSQCPAVLVEEFFLTNAEDVALFGGDEGCRLAAGIYYRAICGYFGLEPR